MEITLLEILDESESLDKQANTLRKLVRQFPHENESEIISYLDSGSLVFLRTMPVFDCLGEMREFIGGVSFFTDGNWIWKSYFVYYIEKYHIELPMGFIEHAKRNNWIPPKITDSQMKLIKQNFIKQLNLKIG